MLEISDNDSEDRLEFINAFEPTIGCIEESTDQSMLIIFFKDESTLVLVNAHDPETGEVLSNSVDTIYEMDTSEEFVDMIYGQLKYSENTTDRQIYQRVEEIIKFEKEFNETVEKDKLNLSKISPEQLLISVLNENQ